MLRGLLVVFTISFVLATFSYMLWAAVEFHRLPYTGILWNDSGEITNFDSKGPAAQAGLSPEDQIVSIAGSENLDVALRERSVGERLEVIVTESEERSVVQLVLAPPSFLVRLHRFEPLLIGSVFWLVSVWMWRSRPRQKFSIVFLFLSQGVTVLFVAGSLSGFHYTLSGYIASGTLLLLAPLTFHFFSLISHWSSPRIIRTIRFLYAVSMVLLAALIMEGWKLEISLTNLREAYVALVLLGAAVVLMRRPARGQMLARHRHHILVSSMLLSLLPLLVGSFVPHLIRGEPLVPYEWTMPFLICLPLGYAYGTRTDHLSRVDLLLNRMLIYLMLAISFVTIYGLVFWVGETLWASYSTLRFVSLALLTLLIMTLFPPLYRWLRHQVDTLLYGGWYDYRSIVREMSQSLNQTRSLEELGDKVLAITRMMHFEAALLHWFPHEEKTSIQHYGFDKQQAETLQASATRIEEELSLNSPDGLNFQPFENESDNRLWWAPLRYKGRLLGVLVTQENLSTTPLTPDDIDILKVVTEGAAVTAENLALVQALQKQLHALEEVRGQLNEAQRHQVESRELERVSLARDLHDGPMQELYGIQYQLQAFVASLPEPQLSSSVQMLQSSLGDVTESLRELCWTLRPPTLSRFGLPMAIKSYIERFTDQHPSLRVNMDLLWQDSLSEAVRLSLFRVFQQALTNVVRHADARTIDVRMWQEADRLFLEVRDDGRGFEVPERWISLGRKGHFGLLGTAERMNTLRGELRVDSSRGHGTTLRVWVPIPAPSNEHHEDNRNSWPLADGTLGSRATGPMNTTKITETHGP